MTITDELQDLLLPGDPHVAVLISVAPVLQPAVLGQLVEMRARRDDHHLGIPGRILADVDLGELDRAMSAIHGVRAGPAAPRASAV